MTMMTMMTMMMTSIMMMTMTMMITMMMMVMMITMMMTMMMITMMMTTMTMMIITNFTDNDDTPSHLQNYLHYFHITNLENLVQNHEDSRSPQTCLCKKNDNTSKKKE